MPTLQIPSPDEADGKVPASTMQFVDSTDQDAPTNPPANPAIAALFSGPNGTLYIWSPLQKAWRPLIAV